MDEFSWHHHPPNILSPVRNQGHRCCCWAITACGACESLWALENENEDPIQLSIQKVINCVIEKYPKSNFNKESSSYYLPSINRAFKYITEYGVCLEAECNFVKRKEPCTASENETKLFIRDYKRCNDLDENGIIELINKHPIGGAVPLYESMENLGGKIYEGKTEEDGNLKGSHAILVVGYGVEDEVKYYGIKNLWGVSWGVEGYGKVRRDLVSLFSYPVEPHFKDD